MKQFFSLNKKKAIFFKNLCFFSTVKSGEEFDFEYYSKIRIYKEKPFIQLLNHYAIATFCKSEFLVSHSLSFVNALKVCLGISIFIKLNFF